MAINSDRPDGDQPGGREPAEREPAERAPAERARDEERQGGGDGGASGADGSAEDVDALVTAGRYAEAARLARDLGDALRAAALYERIWAFGLAADCARDAGDLGRALQNAIDARDETRVQSLAAALDARGDDGRREAAEVFAQRRRFADAAERAEALGDLEAAAAHYGQAHRDLDAARVLDAMGREREAGRLLERFIELGPQGDDLAWAQLRLGLILARRMSHEAAARYLQEAARHEPTRAAARRALVVSLAAMGLRDAARDVLVAARTEEPALPAELDAFLRAERQADAPPAEREPTEAREQVIGGRYRLGELLGAGASGRVFRARDEVSGRDCAVKLLHVSHTRGNQAYERFVREARLASALRHPNLVEIHDVSADQGYLVMELMSGGSLAQRLARGPLPGLAVRRAGLDVLAGLALAHQRGVVHRDVKPANIFFDARGTAKLGDFGVAHLVDLGQTQTGGLIGTLAYMAPEQITGAPLTITADLYSLGVTLFEALTGRTPFLGPDFVAQHLGETPPAPSSVRDDVAPAWDAIIARLLQKSPTERYGSVDELRADIEAARAGDADGPQILVLRRASTEPAAAGSAPDAAGPDAASPDAASPDAASPDAAAPGLVSEPGRDDEPRYQFETPLASTERSQLTRAVDTVLDRSVIKERYREGAMDEAAERRLYALARGGGPFLQRVLAYDRAAGVVVYEAPSGAPMGEAYGASRPSPRRLVRLLKRLARTVAPLHEAHSAHGDLRESTIVVDDDDIPTVLACGLGPADGAASPRDDVAAIVAIIARLAGAPASSAARELALALAEGADEARRAALLALADPADGEALYALADAVEISLLEARRSLL